MDLGNIMKMMGGNMNPQALMKQMNSNPTIQQLTKVKEMLDKLPKEEQTRVITNFVNELNEAVAKVEGNAKDVKTKED